LTTTPTTATTTVNPTTPTSSTTTTTIFIKPTCDCSVNNCNYLGF
jgi:hypothetical protein